MVDCYVASTFCRHLRVLVLFDIGDIQACPSVLPENLFTTQSRKVRGQALLMLTADHTLAHADGRDKLPDQHKVLYIVSEIFQTVNLNTSSSSPFPVRNMCRKGTWQGWYAARLVGVKRRDVTKEYK